MNVGIFHFALNISLRFFRVFRGFPLFLRFRTSKTFSKIYYFGSRVGSSMARRNSGEKYAKFPTSITTANVPSPVIAASESHIGTARANSSGRAQRFQMNTAKPNSNNTMA